MSDQRRRKAAKRARDAAKIRAAPVRHDALGRTHLIVHRDAHGRTLGVGLTQPLFHESWQNEVTVGAANTAHSLFAAGATPETAAELGRRVMAGTSKIADGVVASAGEQAPACKDGCAHCCHQAVGVSPPEVFAIYAHLKATRSSDAFALTLQRIRTADAHTRGLSSNQRISPELPCPFLEAERCSIYEVRPLTCRGKNSLDAAACERTLHEPEARAEFIAGRLAVPCLVEPIRAVHAVAAGLQLALHELHGLAMQPIELTAAVRVLADAPDAVAEAWLTGNDPFLAARGGDTTGDPRIRELSGRRTGGV